LNTHQKTSSILFTVLVALLVWCAYSNTFSSPPVLDDFHTFIFQENVHLKDLSLSSLIAPSKTVFGVQRWLPMLSFSLDLRFGEGEVFYLHLTNLLIHILASLAVLFLVYNLFQVQRETGRAFTLPPMFYAISVAGLWALNPVQTNAVTYLVQRMAAMQALFFVSSAAFYTLGRRKHLDQGHAKQAFPCYLACFLASLGAFLSKENSATLPIMLLVTEVWFFTPNLHRSLWKRLKAAPWFIWVLILIGATGVSFYAVRLFQDLAAGYGIRHFTLLERLLTQSRIVIWYLSLFLWPTLSRLSLEHDVVLSVSLLDPPSTLPAIMLLMILGWLTLRFRRRFPLITYGSVWYFLNLVIESSIVPLELIFEHRLYLPSVGISLVVVCLLVEGLSYLLARRSARDLAIITTCVFALFFSGLTLLTFYRNEAWQSSVTLYEDGVKKAPNHPRAHANLAVAYGRAGLYEKSIRQAETAIALGREHHEQYFVAANTILVSLTGLKRFEEVVERGEYLFQNRPKKFDAGSLTNFQLNLAQAHLKLGNLPDAYRVAMLALQSVRLTGGSPYQLRQVEGMLVAILRAAGERQVDLDGDGINDPGDSSAELWIAKRLLEKGERGEAAYLLTIAIGTNPGEREAVRLLDDIKREDGLNYTQLKKENFRQEYQSSPFSRFNASMALAYLARTPGWSGYFRNVGEKLLDYALEIQPGVADAHLLKAYYVHDRKEIEPAIAATERALALDPDYSRAWLALGSFRMELNDLPGAVTALKRGLELYPGCPQRQSVLAAITAIEQNPALTTAQN